MLAAAFALAPALLAAPPSEITKSARLRGGVHLVPNSQEDGSGAALVIRGDNITVDFGGMTLRGTPPTAEPNERKGTGVIVQGANVTIKNLNVHGYKIGVFARNARGIRILDSNFSYNWKARLLSGLDKEDTADWMSFHQNEKDEWLRFGAGIYLSGCDGAVVKRVTIEGGQCGLMITRTNRARITSNTFRFLSAVGLGMYRSSDNLIQQNAIDWCVRGYSHGVYNRGQDSTGILIYEQSNRNTFAYNSVTHGGDGFFLWAGQTTMDSGRGGCNDNLLVGNDFSHAPTNGIEATFSRNAYLNNLVLECWHGGWLGYSFDSLVWKNVFGFNAEGIAWEHGQDNLIEDNDFIRDNSGILLWQNLSEDPNWGYAKKRDTRSRDNLIKNNRFVDIPQVALSLRNTKSVRLDGNHFIRPARLLQKDQRAEAPVFSGGKILMTPSAWAQEEVLTGLSPDLNIAHVPAARTMQPSGNLILGLDPDNRDYIRRFQLPWNPKASPALQAGLTARYKTAPKIPAWLPGEKNPFIPAGTLRGRRFILVDNWGPYDFKSPLLWPRATRKADGKEVWSFEILGPAGRWSAKKMPAGAILSSSSGTVPGRVEMTIPENTQMVELKLEYVGGATTDYRGIKSPAGAKVPFGFEKFRLPISWTVRHFNYDKDKEDPRTNLEGWKARMAGAIEPKQVSELGGAWYGSPATGINADYFGTIAEGEVTLAPGRYALNVTSDDGVRVWLDGKMVIDNWTYHGPTLDTAEFTASGRHKIRIEHFELNGFSTLKAEIVPKR